LVLWRAAPGSFGDFGEQISEQLWGAFLNNFLEQLWGAAMRGAAFDDAFREQLSGHHFGKPL
jgi:hypothetical protein